MQQRTDNIMTNIRSQNHLAELLDLSRSAVSRLAARGMPTSSVEAAQAWRKANLDPARTKGNRCDEYRRGRPAAPASDEAQCLRLVRALMDAAAAALEADQRIDHLTPSLRHALAAVPFQQRDAVGLDVGVMAVLVSHVIERLPPKEGNPRNDDGSSVWCDGASLSDQDAQELGEFWYAVAAGELLRPEAP
jgi:hypothetical protein